MRKTRRAVAVVLSALVLALSAAPQALADGALAGGDVHVAQTLGDRELTVVLRRVDTVPGPLRVNVITHAGTAPERCACGSPRPVSALRPPPPPR